jgi:hypothetical protein
MGFEYELNVDFDLSLRRGWSGPASGSQVRQIEEMAFHVMLVGGPRDSMRLPAEVPEEFLTALGGRGIEPPELTIRPAIDRGRQLRPFGWNTAMVELNERYDRPTPHPPLQAVRQVNGRSFGVAVERQFGGQEFHLGEFQTVEELRKLLSHTAPRQHGWVAKSLHGNAGLGNRRLRSSRLSELDCRWLQAMLAEDERVLLEPWVCRVADLCVTYELDGTGRIHELMTHEIVNTADGSFIGAVFDPSSAVCQPWMAQLENVACDVAGRLSEAGYFGPVCLDAFVWDDAGEPRLRPLVDLNARFNVSRGAARLWQHMGGDDVVYWRLFSRRKLALPDSRAELEAELAGNAFDRDSRRGVLVTSPLWVIEGGRRRRLNRLGIAIVGRSRADVMQQERWFRGRFER